MKRSFFLVIRADGTQRTVTKINRGIRWDEVAYKVVVDTPDAWGEVNGEIDVTMPDPPAAKLTLAKVGPSVLDGRDVEAG